MGVLGPVFRTYDPERDRLVAVKAFHLDLTPEQAELLVDALMRIVELGLSHPALVAPIDAGLEDGVPFLAQEYVTAESLDVAMRHYAPATPEQMLAFIVPLAEALDAAHARGVVHGALHLRDVFVTPDAARATGFGVASALEHVGLRVPVRRPYTAPEVIAGRHWGPAADRFSVATIAYELLTGRRATGTGEEVLAHLRDCRPAEIADPASLQQAFRNALADDPALRPASAGRFAAALAQAIGIVPHLPAEGRRGRPAPDDAEDPGELDEAGARDELDDDDLEDADDADDLDDDLRLREDPAVERDVDRDTGARAEADRPELDDRAGQVSRGDRVTDDSFADGPVFEIGRPDHRRTEDVRDTWADRPLMALDPEAAAADAADGDADDALDAAADDDGGHDWDGWDARDLGAPGDGAGAVAADAPDEEPPSSEPEAPWRDRRSPGRADDAGREPAEGPTVGDAIAAYEADHGRQPEYRGPGSDDDEADPGSSGAGRREGVRSEPDDDPWEGRQTASTPPRYQPPPTPRASARTMAPILAAVVIGAISAYWLYPDLGPGTRGDGPDPVAPDAAVVSDRTDAGDADAPPSSTGTERAWSEARVETGPADASAPAAPGSEATPPGPQTPRAQRPPESNAPAGASEPAVVTRRPPEPPSPPARRPPAPAPAPAPPAVGWLLVRTDPPGAVVEVNGEARGEAPLSLGEMSYGTYRLEISAPGHATETRTATVSAAQPIAAVSVTLMPTGPVSPPGGAAGPVGSVTVNSRPAGADVYLDDARVGVTPLVVPDVRPGAHQVRIQRDGYRVWATTIDVRSGEPTPVAASLEPGARR